jgi:flagellar biogenesis protein FliO
VLGALLPLGGVLAGAAALLFGLKRLLRGTRPLGRSQRILKVRDVLALGPKRAIYLIELEERNLVVALSGDQLALLSEYSCEPDEATAAPAAAAAAQAPAAPAPVATAIPAAAPAAPAPAPAARTLDVVVADDVEVPPLDAAPPPRNPATTARPFSFTPVRPAAARTQARTDRIPERFRQLLDQAAAADGQGR